MNGNDSLNLLSEEELNVLSILRSSLWNEGDERIPITESIESELEAQAVKGLAALSNTESKHIRYKYVSRFVRMINVQTNAVQALKMVDIPVVVLKGTAAGIYYPYPFLRTYGDIDLLVHPENYKKAIGILLEKGYVQRGKIGRYHTAFEENSFTIELHQSPPDLDDIKEGKFILEYLLAGMDDIQTAVIAQPRCEFPMLPWKQNGLELIWHIREHLYSGLGLRQIIDWMFFVNRHLDDKAFFDYKEILQKSGLLVLAQNVTRMCQLYLGLTEVITWCSDADDSVCAELMKFIFEQGDLGHKRRNDKVTRILTRYNTPISFFRGLQKKGLIQWKAAKKYAVLRPFAWFYMALKGLKIYWGEDGREKIRKDREESKKRRNLLKKIYGDEGKRIQENEKAQRRRNRIIKEEKTDSELAQRRDTWRSPSELKLKKIYYWIRKTSLRIPLFYVNEWYYIIRNSLYNKPLIADDDRKNVESNVTFIYKSFNRQRLATRLYKSIKSYYPEAKVIVVDDSEDPLILPNMKASDDLIYLPFNSGLSKGIITALERVDTPYVMRLEDDVLLIPASNIGGELSFLEKHEEVDLTSFQATHRSPQRMANYYSRIRMNKKLLIPEGTIIDGHQVVYKTPNIYLARTESIRKIGFDPNIRMIDHHEFFYRAAGEIVCVQNPDSYVMHCHNYFEKEKYTKYRSDVNDDIEYLKKKYIKKN